MQNEQVKLKNQSYNSLIHPSLNVLIKREKATRRDGKRLKDGLIWDDAKEVYLHRRNKQPISDKYLYKIVSQEVERNAQKQAKLATQLVNGKLPFEDWQKRSIDLVRQSHVDMARLGRGGKDRTWGIHYLEVGNDLRKTHYPAFRQFAQDIKDGKLTAKQIVARSNLYSSATKSSFEKARISTKSGLGKRGRRKLGGCKNHCNDCLYYASIGWQPLELVTPPGINCQCKGNCCCSVEIEK